VEDLSAAAAALAPQVELLVVTRGEAGASAVCRGVEVTVPAARGSRVVDTTGAGDMFAAGFLFAHARDRPLGDCLSLGARLAAEIIADYGARPRATCPRSAGEREESAASGGLLRREHGETIRALLKQPATG
jgi:sugar/nucleoside kinase (ribokinase family)